MKKLLLSIFTLTTLAGFSQWQPTSIFFQGENLTYAFGKILSSDDGFNTYQHSTTDGVSWSTAGVSGVPTTGLRFGVLNGSTLYAHYNDKIYQSANGTSWSLMTAATATSDVVKSMCVVNGTVLATTSPQSGVSSKILELSGSNWVLRASHSGTIISVIQNMGNILWAGTSTTLTLKSTNGGISFTSGTGTLNPSATYNKYARCLASTSSAYYMGNDGGRIYKSTDAGLSWGPAYTVGAPSSSSISDFYITPSNAILVACDSGFVYSLDGTTWTKDNAGFGYTGPTLNDQLLKVTMSANNIIVSTKNGKVYYRTASQILSGINEITPVAVKSIVYPNPSYEFITIEASDLQFETKCEIKITDMLGREISNIEMKNGRASTSLDNFSKGVYTYSIYNNSTVVSKGKLVVN